jgi:hypothetical protein
MSTLRKLRQKIVHFRVAWNYKVRTCLKTGEEGIIFL